METTFSYNVNDIDFINNFMTNMFNKNIKKAKVYVKNPQDVPQGTKVSRGDRGGLYYESEEQQHFTQEVSNIEQNIKNTMKFSDTEEKEAQKLFEIFDKFFSNFVNFLNS